jgi:hypothetical protein
MLIQEEGARVDKNVYYLMDYMNLLCDTIATSNPINVYHSDETDFSFQFFQDTVCKLQFKDTYTTRGLKKSKDRTTLVVCTNATGNHKIP